MTIGRDNSPSPSRRQSRTLQVALLLAIVASGVLGLQHESSLYRAVEPWANIHALFAALLITFVLLRFRLSMPLTLPRSANETYVQCRQLKRIVYLLLYGIIAVRQVIAFATALWNGGAFDFDIAALRATNEGHYFGFDPNNDAHLFFACGLLAVAVVHLLIMSMPRSAVAIPTQF